MKVIILPPGCIIMFGGKRLSGQELEVEKRL